MKKIITATILLASFLPAFSQATSTYPADVDKAFALIKNGAFKHGYDHMITFANTNAAAINVNPNNGYLFFFVYDNTNHPAPKFKVFLMTPDSALQKKYTSRPYDRAQVGVARAAQLEIRTPAFTGNPTRPVKIEAIPKATIYVFHKK